MNARLILQPIRVFAIMVFVSISMHALMASTCCPKFTMNMPEICSDSNSFRSTAGTLVLKACKNSTNVYAVYPYAIGYTYIRNVVGGTLVSTSNNTATIA